MFVVIQGIKIYVDRSGTGKSLVLIHGLGTQLVWMHVQQRLSQSFDVITIHLPGFGFSDPSSRPLSTGEYAKILLELFNELELKSILLLGVSYGGHIAATIAQVRPEQIDRLILTCSSGLMTRYDILRYANVWQLVSLFSTYALLKSYFMVRIMNRVLYYDYNKQPPQMVHEFHHTISQTEKRDNWLQCVRNAATPTNDFTTKLSVIKIPTLILWGQNDRVIPAKYAYEFQQRIKGSELKIFDECGHALPIEKPEEFCNAAKEFLLRK